MKSWVTASVAALVMFSADGIKAEELTTEQERLSYMFGMDIGRSLAAQGEALDLDVLFEAVRAVYEGGETAMSPEEADAVRQAYIVQRPEAQAALQAAAAGTNAAQAQAFLAENAGKDGIVTTASGLQYEVVTQGDGPRPAATDTVTVHYKGTLLDGTEFDSSYSRNEPISFALDRVIPGWTEGVQLMPVGSKYIFYIPPQLGYGKAGGGPIPPNSALIFEVELLDIQG